MDIDELTSVPHPLQTLIDEKFRAVRVAAGDSISAAISSEGELRVWGSFRVSITLFKTNRVVTDMIPLGKRRFTRLRRWSEAPIHTSLNTRT